jgi:hypothetical protein
MGKTNNNKKTKAAGKAPHTGNPSPLISNPSAAAAAAPASPATPAKTSARSPSAKPGGAPATPKAAGTTTPKTTTPAAAAAAAGAPEAIVSPPATTPNTAKARTVASAERVENARLEQVAASEQDERARATERGIQEKIEATAAAAAAAEAAAAAAETPEEPEAGVEAESQPEPEKCCWGYPVCPLEKEECDRGHQEARRHFESFAAFPEKRPEDLHDAVCYRCGEKAATHLLVCRDCCHAMCLPCLTEQQEAIVENDPQLREEAREAFVERRHKPQALGADWRCDAPCRQEHEDSARRSQERSDAVLAAKLAQDDAEEEAGTWDPAPKKATQAKAPKEATPAKAPKEATPAKPTPRKSTELPEPAETAGRHEESERLAAKGAQFFRSAMKTREAEIAADSGAEKPARRTLGFAANTIDLSEAAQPPPASAQARKAELQTGWEDAITSVAVASKVEDFAEKLEKDVSVAVVEYERANPDLRDHFPEKNVAGNRTKADAESKKMNPHGALSIDIGNSVSSTSAGDAVAHALRTRLEGVINWSPNRDDGHGNTRTTATSKRAQYLRLQQKQAQYCAGLRLADCAAAYAFAAATFLVLAVRTGELLAEVASVQDQQQRDHPDDSTSKCDRAVLDYTISLMQLWEQKQRAARLGGATEARPHDTELYAALEAKRRAEGEEHRPTEHDDFREEHAHPTTASPRRRPREGERGDRDSNREVRSRPSANDERRAPRTPERSRDRPPPYYKEDQERNGAGGGGADRGAGGSHTRGSEKAHGIHEGLAGHDCSKHDAKRQEDCIRCYKMFPNGPAKKWRDHDWRYDCIGGKAPALRGSRGDRKDAKGGGKRRHSDSD